MTLNRRRTNTDLTKFLPPFAVFLTLCAQLFAHHGSSIYYDIDKPITLTGTVTEFLWSNPHAQIYFEVKDARGHIVKWAGELNSTGSMIRAGWNKRMLKAGDRITVTVFPAKIGTPIGVIDQSKGVIVNGKPLQTGEPAAPPH